jgi:hypothetical protein
MKTAGIHPGGDSQVCSPGWGVLAEKNSDREMLEAWPANRTKTLEDLIGLQGKK